MVVAVAAPILAAAVGLSLWASRSAIVFFYGPSEAMRQHVPVGQTVRIGGLVRPGSVIKTADGEVRFAIADQAGAVSAAAAAAEDEALKKSGEWRKGEGAMPAKPVAEAKTAGAAS